MIVGLIPARSGSKGVPNKNIRLLGGYPLMAWSIAASKMSEFIDRTIVSTNSAEYALVAVNYGAEILMRPTELATDKADDNGYLLHFLENCDCKWIVLLRPTTPLRDPREIDLALMRVRTHPEYTSLRSMFELSEPYQKTGYIQGMRYRPFSPEGNFPRQYFIPNYSPNGYVDVLKPGVVRKGLLYGDRIASWITKNVGEVDSEEDFDYIEWKLAKYGSPVYDYLKNQR